MGAVWNAFQESTNFNLRGMAKAYSEFSSRSLRVCRRVGSRALSFSMEERSLRASSSVLFFPIMNDNEIKGHYRCALEDRRQGPNDDEFNFMLIKNVEYGEKIRTPFVHRAPFSRRQYSSRRCADGLGERAIKTTLSTNDPRRTPNKAHQ